MAAATPPGNRYNQLGYDDGNGKKQPVMEVVAQ